MTRSATSYLLRSGEGWLMLPPRIAALIEKRTDVGRLRVQMRGIDPEATAVLEALRIAAMSWRGSSTGTEDDKQQELATDLSKWVSSGQAARLAGISREAIGKAIRSGRLPATQIQGRWRIDREELNHWKATRDSRRSQ